MPCTASYERERGRRIQYEEVVDLVTLWENIHVNAVHIGYNSGEYPLRNGAYNYRLYTTTNYTKLPNENYTKSGN